MKRYIRSNANFDLDLYQQVQQAKKSKDPEELESIFTQYFEPNLEFMSDAHKILSEVAKNRYTPEHVLESLYFDAERPIFRNFVATNPNCPERIIRDIVEHSNNTTLLSRLGKNKNCPIDILQDIFTRAIDEEDHFLLAGLANNSKLTPEMFSELREFILDPVHYNKNYAYDVVRGLNKNSGFRKYYDIIPLL